MDAAGVAGVRNRIGHWREEEHAGRWLFRPARKFDAVCHAVNELVYDLCNAGSCPTVFERMRSVTDAFGRVRLDYGNGRHGQTISLYEPTALAMCGLPRSRAHVPVPVATIEGANDCLRFRVVETSAFGEMRRAARPLRLPHPPAEAEMETVDMKPVIASQSAAGLRRRSESLPTCAAVCLLGTDVHYELPRAVALARTVAGRGHLLLAEGACASRMHSAGELLDPADGLSASQCLGVLRLGQHWSADLARSNSASRESLGAAAISAKRPWGRFPSAREDRSRARDDLYRLLHPERLRRRT